MNAEVGPANNEVDALLDALDAADAALRAVYLKLADNPDLASEHESALKELHAKRLDLAQRVGLAALARRRADAKVTQPIVVPVVPSTAPAPAPEPPAIPGPATEPSEPEQAPARRASDTAVAEWKTRVQTTGLGTGLRGTPSTGTAWALVLHELMDAVGPLRDLETTVGMIEELDALDEVASSEQQELWARLPKHTQQVWLSMLVARTRALKHLPSLSPEAKSRLKVILGRYPAWAKAHFPGHVNGLQLKHEPRNGSWVSILTTMGPLVSHEHSPLGPVA